MLEFFQVGFSYPNAPADAPALRNISFSLRSGTVTVLLGPNASGKSTLLLLAAGLRKPRRGAVRLENRELTQWPPKSRARQIAFLAQWNAVPDLTARELAAHGRYPHLSARRVLGPRDREIIARALELTGALAFADRQLGELSGGQRQKARLAMAVAQDTPILLLDEPTTYLDVRVQLELAETLRQLAAAGKTVLLALHDLPLALRCGDHALLLQEGELLYDGAADALPRSGIIEQAFGITGIERSNAQCLPGTGICPPK
ncbi:MAG: ABC transporter ATP-binding protein [Oscillospiraceae bacterium]|jgi:iron complex transport system ATP-binding protein|nr:ABC transporter ATP-binding protein [Oscillospiraceae bacterium]